MPTVTIVCSFRNEAAYLRDAILSINAQTYRDFDAVFVDDGSDDGSADILNSTANFNYRLIRHHTSRGLSQSLNEAAAITESPLIARLDADDMMFPQRLERQVEMLASHPSLVMVGSAAEKMDEAGIPLSVWKVAASNSGCRFALNLYNPFIHPSVMFRLAAFNEAGRYRVTTDPAEDYSLFCRLAGVGEVANLPEPLIRYRVRRGGITGTRRAAQLAKHLEIVRSYSNTSGPPFGEILVHLRGVVSVARALPAPARSWYITHSTTVAYGAIVRGLRLGRAHL